jgi:hypothetical protein
MALFDRSSWKTSPFTIWPESKYLEIAVGISNLKGDFNMVDFGKVDYLAVILATVATMILGFLWYSPVLFGRAWVKQMGKKMEEMSGGGPLTYLLTALTALGGSYILALLITLCGETTIACGLGMGLLLGLVLALKIGMNYLFEGRTFTLYFITVSYHVASFLVSGLIIGAMQG